MPYVFSSYLKKYFQRKQRLIEKVLDLRNIYLSDVRHIHKSVYLKLCFFTIQESRKFIR